MSDHRTDTMDVQRAREVLIDLTIPPLRNDRDISIPEFIALVADTRDIELTERQAQYRLDQLVKAGLAEDYERWDPFEGRVIRVFEPTEAGFSTWDELTEDK